MKKLKILYYALAGNVLKLYVNYCLFVSKRITQPDHVDSSLIVSLTSYGVRARRSVHYTLFSLLKQRVRPYKIILWLDEAEFNEQTLPASLKVLSKRGIEIGFCKNIRSYKKLIPTLRKYPEKHIVTVDDDIYYSSNLTSELLRWHQQHPEAVIAEACAIPALETDGGIAPYSKWQKLHLVGVNFKYNSRLLFPVGYGGVLYPAGTFDEEVLNEDIFTQLCPIADDIWFYIMGLRRNRQKVMSRSSQVRYYHVDLFRQAWNKDRLTQSNAAEGHNDVQLKSLLQHYNLSLHHFQSAD